MKKYTPAFSLILLIIGVMVILHHCTHQIEEVPTGAEHTPVSKYKIDSVANEVGLIRLHPELEHSECGLADDDFIEYARKRVDHRRQFQFMVFIGGTTMTGKRCYRRALIFYLK